MRTKLIDVLNITIQDLKLNRKEYNWTDQNKCNCGLVAQNVLRNDKFIIYDGWSAGARRCKQTGAAINGVFARLFAIGLTEEDIIHLEHQNNIEILKEAGLRADLLNLDTGETCSYGRSEKKSFIKYLEAWVRILEREKDETVTVPETAPKEMEFKKYEQMKKENNLIYQN